MKNVTIKGNKYYQRLYKDDNHVPIFYLNKHLNKGQKLIKYHQKYKLSGKYFGVNNKTFKPIIAKGQFTINWDIDNQVFEVNFECDNGNIIKDVLNNENFLEEIEVN